MSATKPLMPSPVPWSITEATPKKPRQIVDKKGATVCTLTALDLPNAELIVEGVNNVGHITYIREVEELEIGREYWLVDKDTGRRKISTLLTDGPIGTLNDDEVDSRCYFEQRIWAYPGNEQALRHWNIFGPLPVRPVPNFNELISERIAKDKRMYPAMLVS